MGYKIEIYNYYKYFGNFISKIIRQKVVILREDRGLLENGFSYPWRENITNVLTLERIKYALFQKKMSSNPKEQEIFERIREHFKTMTEEKYNFNIVLVDEKVHEKKLLFS